MSYPREMTSRSFIALLGCAILLALNGVFVGMYVFISQEKTLLDKITKVPSVTDDECPDAKCDDVKCPSLMTYREPQSAAQERSRLADVDCTDAVSINVLATADVKTQANHSNTFAFKRFPKEEAERIKAERRNWTSAEWASEVVHMLRENAMEHKTVLVTVCNFGMRDFTMNWIASLLKTGYNKFLVFSFDSQLHDFMIDYGFARQIAIVPREWMYGNVSGELHGWLAAGYLDLLRSRITIIKSILQNGFTLFMSDVDLVFLSPHVMLAIEQEGDGMDWDWLYMVDDSVKGIDNINGGFWIMKPRAYLLEMWTTVLNLSLRDTRLAVDQLALSHYLRKIKPDLQYKSRKLRGLGKLLFPTGRLLKSKSRKRGIYPVVAHANYLENQSAKYAFLAANKMWYLGDNSFPD